MIEELRIKDLGVIEHAHVQFGPGLNALTGETGAGKTMALTSLMMLMGAKIDSAKVRAGAQAAVVDGTFVVDAHSPAIDIVRNAGETSISTTIRPSFTSAVMFRRLAELVPMLEAKRYHLRF